MAFLLAILEGTLVLETICVMVDTIAVHLTVQKLALVSISFRPTEGAVAFHIAVLEGSLIISTIWPLIYTIFKFVVFEKAFTDRSICKNHPTFAVERVLSPVTLY